MKLKRLRPACLLLTGLALCAFTGNEKVTDYLHTGETITFNDTAYELAWSSNPVENYFKQEYLPEGRTTADFNDMLILEAIKGDLSVEDAAALKVAELTEWKKTNPVINWNVYKSKDEVLIDFVISDGETLYEWDLYRYTRQEGKKGSYLVLCSYLYQDNILTKEDLETFFNRILENRNDYIKKLGELDLPKVKTS